MTSVETKVVGLVERIVSAMIIKHDEFLLNATSRFGVLNINMEANTGDAKRIVGKNGCHISSLLTIAWTLARNNGVLRITFGRVQSGPGDEVAYEKFEPTREYDIEPVRNLINDVVREAFGSCSVVIKPRCQASVAATVTLPIKHTCFIENFYTAMHTLFIPIGMRVGRIVYVTINGIGAEDHRAADAARRGTRPDDIPCQQPNQRGAQVPREHRRELGERNLHVRRFRDETRTGTEEEWRPGGAQ